MPVRGRGRGGGGLAGFHPPGFGFVAPKEDDETPQPAEKAPEPPAEQTAEQAAQEEAVEQREVEEEEVAEEKEVGREFSVPPAAPSAAPAKPINRGARGRSGTTVGSTRSATSPSPPTTTFGARPEQPAAENTREDRPYTPRGGLGGPRGRGGPTGRGGRGGFSSANANAEAAEENGAFVPFGSRPLGSSRGGGSGANSTPLGGGPRGGGDARSEAGSRAEGGGRGPTEDDECRYCHTKGHFVRNCPNKIVFKCFECDQPGHLARDCPLKAASRSKDGKREFFVPRICDIPTIFEEDERMRNLYTQIAEKDDELEVTKADGQPPESVAKLDNWEDASLIEPLKANIKRAGYTLPRKIQAFSIPLVLEGVDLIGQAETGSGKSAAFLVPLIHRIHEKVEKKEEMRKDDPFAIILEPTRELAVQVYDQARKLADKTKVRVVKAYGEFDFTENAKEIFRGCDLVVATPGRLLDFLESSIIALKFLDHVVLDEGDRMLDDGFGPRLHKIFAFIRRYMAASRATDVLQVLLFSATFPERLESFGREVLRRDHFVVRNHRHALPNNRIRQSFESMAGEEKKHRMFEYCRDILQEFEAKKKAQEEADATVKAAAEEAARAETAEAAAGELTAERKAVLEPPRILVFCSSRAKADAFAIYLNNLHMRALSINGDRPQSCREIALSQFRRGEINVLVATDVAGRGLDIKDMDYVLNFDLPRDISTYIQRIGRTGRLRQGFAHSFFDPEMDKNLAPELVKLLRSDNIDVPPFLLEGGEPRVEPEPVVQPVEPVQQPVDPFGDDDVPPAPPAVENASPPPARSPGLSSTESGWGQPRAVRPAAAFATDPEGTATPPWLSSDDDGGPSGFEFA